MEKLKVGEYYPVALGEPVPVGTRHKDYRVRATDEKRAPKRGEWYLSGSPIEGYKSYNNMHTKYHIGVLVEGEIVSYWKPKNSHDS